MTDSLKPIQRAVPVPECLPQTPARPSSPLEGDVSPGLSSRPDRVDKTSLAAGQKSPPPPGAGPKPSESSGEPLKITLIHTSDFQGMADPQVHLDGNGCAPELGENFFGYTTPVNPSVIREGRVPLAALMHSEIENLKKREEGHYLLLGSGDIDQSYPLSGFSQAQIFDLVDGQGYDAQCPGNHEFDFGDETFLANLKKYRIPFVAANVVDAASGEPLDGLPPYLIREVNGLRIGIIGLACPQTPQYSSEGKLGKARFLTIPEMQSRTQEIVDHLKDRNNPRKVDLVLALTHLGYRDDRNPFDDVELARQVKGIDIILGGHSHRRTGEAFKIEGTDTYYAQDGSFFASVGQMDIQVDPGTKKILGASHVLLPTVAGNVQADPEILALTRRYEEMNEAENSRVLGTAPGVLTFSGLTDSPLGNFMADSMREKSGADVALTISKLAASVVPAGGISLGQVRDSVTCDSSLFMVNLSGDELGKLLWKTCRGASREAGKSMLLQQSGLAVSYDPARPEAPPAVSFGGKPLSIDRNYRVVLDGTTVKYLEKELPPGSREKLPATLTEAMAAFLESHRVVSAERDFRTQDFLPA